MKNTKNKKTQEERAMAKRAKIERIYGKDTGTTDTREMKKFLREKGYASLISLIEPSKVRK